MLTDWKQEIAVAWLVKQTMMESDEGNIFPYHMPEQAATNENITSTEKSLGQALDPGYKNYLRCANGWRAFWHSADLFGTADLIGGQRKQMAEVMLDLIPNGVLLQAGVRRSDLLPISIAQVDKDIFVIVRPSSPIAGTVIWFAGEEVERYKSFYEYFLAMVNFSRQDVEWLRNRKNS